MQNNMQNNMQNTNVNNTSYYQQSAPQPFQKPLKTHYAGKMIGAVISGLFCLFFSLLAIAFLIYGINSNDTIIGIILFLIFGLPAVGLLVLTIHFVKKSNAAMKRREKEDYDEVIRQEELKAQSGYYIRGLNSRPIDFDAANAGFGDNVQAYIDSIIDSDCIAKYRKMLTEEERNYIFRKREKQAIEKLGSKELYSSISSINTYLAFAGTSFDTLRTGKNPHTLKFWLPIIFGIILPAAVIAFIAIKFGPVISNPVLNGITLVCIFAAIPSALISFSHLNGYAYFGSALKEYKKIAPQVSNIPSCELEQYTIFKLMK